MLSSCRAGNIQGMGKRRHARADSGTCSEDADAPASRHKAHTDGDTRTDKKAAKESKKSKKRRKEKKKDKKEKKSKKERKKEQKAQRSSPSSASSSRSSGISRDGGSDIGEENGQQLLGQKFSKVPNPENSVSSHSMLTFENFLRRLFQHIRNDMILRFYHKQLVD